MLLVLVSELVLDELALDLSPPPELEKSCLIFPENREDSKHNYFFYDTYAVNSF